MECIKNWRKKLIFSSFIVFFTITIATNTLAYDISVCNNIASYQNISKVGYVVYYPDSSTQIDSIKTKFHLSYESILESSDLQNSENILLENCLILPKTEGIFKIIHSLDSLNYFLAAFGVSQTEFLEFNPLFPTYKQSSPAIVFLPIIPPKKTNRKYAFPITGSRLVKNYMSEEPNVLTLINQPFQGIELLGKKYNADVIAIDGGTVLFAGYTEESYKLSKHVLCNTTILIEHNNKILAFYEFTALKMMVKKGDKIQKGDVIAKYGSDGHNHSLTLKIKKNNKIVNPMNLFLTSVDTIPPL